MDHNQNSELVEHARGMRASACSTAEFIQDVVHLGTCNRHGARRLIICEEVIFNVELESDGRFHLTDGGDTA